MYLLIHAGIKVKPCYKKGVMVTHTCMNWDERIIIGLDNDL